MVTDLVFVGVTHQNTLVHAVGDQPVASQRRHIGSDVSHHLSNKHLHEPSLASNLHQETNPFNKSYSVLHDGQKHTFTSFPDPNFQYDAVGRVFFPLVKDFQVGKPFNLKFKSISYFSSQ